MDKKRREEERMAGYYNEIGFRLALSLKRSLLNLRFRRLSPSASLLVPSFSLSFSFRSFSSVPFLPDTSTSFPFFFHYYSQLATLAALFLVTAGGEPVYCTPFLFPFSTSADLRGKVTMAPPAFTARWSLPSTVQWIEDE